MISQSENAGASSSKGIPLSELLDHRLPDPTGIAAGEFAKSGRTRTRIMEAAVDCLASRGCASLSMSSVAKAAGVTRAAMLYHFPSRIRLIEAAAHFVTRKRVEMYGAAMADIAWGEGYYEQVIDFAWQQLQTPEFLAFAELSNAARTDPELSAVFAPALAEFDRARRDLALKLFPAKAVETPWFDLRRDIARFLLEGLAQMGGLSFDTERRRAEMINFLKALNATPEGEALLALTKAWPSSE